MAFQRSYSKVWWGSDSQLPANMKSTTIGSLSGSGTSSSGGGGGGGGGYYYGYLAQQQQQSQHQSGYHSLDLNGHRGFAGNLSRIQEVDDEQNISRLSTAWEKRDSPGSLRSQDSGFSDNDESHSTRSLGGRSSIGSKASSPSTRSAHSQQGGESPMSVSGVSLATPPTVVRRVAKSEFYSPVVSVSRRISFTGPPVSTPNTQDLESTLSSKHNEVSSASSGEHNGSTLMSQLDEMSLLNSTPLELEVPSPSVKAITKPKRRRRVSRRATKPLTPTKRRTMVEREASDSDDDELAYVVSDGDDLASAERPQQKRRSEAFELDAGTPPPPYNNETVYLGGEMDLSLVYIANTSTPKRQSYENPLLNGHPAALQSWLGDLRQSCEPEVMSTLQTKSIAQEAFKNLQITTNTVTKLIRQLQQRAICLQSDFERIERLLAGSGASGSSLLRQALDGTEHLLQAVAEFTLVLERRAIFFADSRIERRRYNDNIEQIRNITKDTRYSLERHHYISLESLLDDVQVLKRYLLIAIRQVFERMVRVIVGAVETGRCDLMLRANINMIATLSNIDYEGFASLTNAFVQCETVRTLLIVCLEHRASSVRALALRALATICCAPEAIAQMSTCSGIEILRDALQGPPAETSLGDSAAVTPKGRSAAVAHEAAWKRTDAERREAVSLLTQITAVWHGPNHRVDGLRDSVESIVEGLTQLVTHTRCSQTLLLCAAALNNLSRIEVTSHYSIMSNESIFRVIEAAEQKTDDGVSIFYYEQVVAMLHNMSLNKKCHSHLANGSIINFITSAYQTEFYKGYESRAEIESQRRTVKAILHTLTRLVHDSNLGVDLLEQQRNAPAFLRCRAASPNTAAADLSQLHAEISLLARDLLWAQQEDQLSQLNESVASAESAVDCGALVGGETRSGATETITSATGLKLNLARQESYV